MKYQILISLLCTLYFYPCHSAYGKRHLPAQQRALKTRNNQNPVLRNSESEAISGLIRSKKNTTCPGDRQKYQKEIEQRLAARPGLALTPEDNYQRHATPLCTAIGEKNKETVHFILALPIQITPEQKYAILSRAINYQQSFEIVYELIEKYNFPIILPHNNKTITDSLFSSLLSYARRYKQYTPEEKSTYTACFRCMLSIAATVLHDKKDFHSFTRFYHGQCPLGFLLSERNNIPNDESFFSPLLSSLYCYGVTCTEWCHEAHKEIFPFSPLKKLLNQEKHIDM